MGAPGSGRLRCPPLTSTYWGPSAWMSLAACRSSQATWNRCLRCVGPRFLLCEMPFLDHSKVGPPAMEVPGSLQEQTGYARKPKSAGAALA